MKRATKLNKNNAARVVREIIRIANTWVDEHRTDHKNDLGMLQSGYKDAADMLEIALYIKRGQFIQASKKNSELDTIVREMMPDELRLFWNSFLKLPSL